MLELDGDCRQSSPTRRSDQLFNIDLISDCILEYTIHDYIRNSVEVKVDNYYYTNKTSVNLKYNLLNDNDIDFIDDDNNDKVEHNNKYPRFAKPKNIIRIRKQTYNKLHNNDNVDLID